MNIYLLVAFILILGFIFGRILRKLKLTEILAYILSGIIIGRVLNFSPPEQFSVIISGTTLALIAYIVGLSFSFDFLKRMGKQMVIILIVQVLITVIATGGIVYLLTRDLPLSIILGSLAGATDPAGTIAVFRDLRAKGGLTDMTTALVGLDDAVVIVVYAVGIALTKMLLGAETGISFAFTDPLWEIFGGLGLGGAIGAGLSYFAKKVHLTSDNIFVISLAAAILCWGIAEMMEVSAMLTCMALGTAVINLNVQIGNRSNELLDNIMTPIFVLFFAAIGMEMDFSVFYVMWPLVIMYCVGRSIGKIAGCSLGGVLARSESKIKKYLGLAMLPQAGVAMGLAFLAAQALSGYELGGKIITIMTATTVVFGLLSPPLVQYAVKKAGEARR
ncbi:MAG: cation:proton antiporter [Dehalococcoidia bacterium]|nr:cation:proton antiporter [Dehalococcoidia bacterium]